MKNKIALLTISSLLSLTACNNAGGGKDKKAYDVTDENYYSNVTKRVAFDNENELNFEEEFDNGLNNEIWNCLDGAWHTDVKGGEHNGVKKRNLFYTKDSNNNNYLAIKGRGYYNKSDLSILGKPEGGVIETKKHLIPGRYEIKMAALPREGAVSAMWTYCTTTGSELTSQNEIDIEIGGTTKGTQFEYEWCTSWTKQSDKQTDTINVTDLLYLNDGKIHSYVFDWYTNYDGNDTKRVDWFIDGHFIDSLEGSMVPDHAMPLWVGVWFPPLWAGSAAFEEDYMLIDAVKFTAFDESQYYDNCRSYVTYTPVDPNTVNIQTIPFDDVTKNLNKFANGNMDSSEICQKDDSYYGWVKDSPDRFKGTLSIDTVNKTEGSGAFKLEALNEEDGGIYLGQTISNSFEGYKYHLSIDAKKGSEDAEGNIEIHYRKDSSTKISGKNIAIDSTTFKTYEYDLLVPKGAKIIKIYVTSEKGTLYYDNARLYRVVE